MKGLSIVLGVSCMLMATLTQAMPIPPDEGHPKWSQPPDLVDGNDTVSMHRSFGPVVADDFVFNGTEIVGFHWWGSYFQDTGQGPERDVTFEISFHENCPTGDATCGNGGPFPYSTPSDGNYFSDIFVVEEDFYGTTDDGVDLYEYWARVDANNGPSFLNGTWEGVDGETYWLDVAWNAGQLGTNIGDDAWGWARADNGRNCILGCAVTTRPGGSSNPHIGPWDMLRGEDMAFEVIDAPEPGTLALLGLGLLSAGFARRRRAD